MEELLRPAPIIDDLGPAEKEFVRRWADAIAAETEEDEVEEEKGK